MPRVRYPELLSTEEVFQKLTVDQLKPLAKIIHNEVPQHKGDLVALLTRTLLDPKRVRELYEKLDETSKIAIQEAVQDPESELQLQSFTAKHGRAPSFGKRSSGYRDPAQPTALALFFPDPYRRVLPIDLEKVLHEFVPKPPPVAVTAVAELPAGIMQQVRSWREGKSVVESQETPLQVRMAAMISATAGEPMTSRA